jgi:hypothetical protein
MTGNRVSASRAQEIIDNYLRKQINKAGGEKRDWFLVGEPDHVERCRPTEIAHQQMPLLGALMKMWQIQQGKEFVLASGARVTDNSNVEMCDKCGVRPVVARRYWKSCGRVVAHCRTEGCVGDKCKCTGRRGHLYDREEEVVQDVQPMDDAAGVLDQDAVFGAMKDMLDKRSDEEKLEELRVWIARNSTVCPSVESSTQDGESRACSDPTEVETTFTSEDDESLEFRFDFDTCGGSVGRCGEARACPAPTHDQPSEDKLSFEHIFKSVTQGIKRRVAQAVRRHARRRNWKIRQVSRRRKARRAKQKCGVRLAYTLPQIDPNQARIFLGLAILGKQVARGRKDRGLRPTGAARRAKKNAIRREAFEQEVAENEESARLLNLIEPQLRVASSALPDVVETNVVEVEPAVGGAGTCWVKLFKPHQWVGEVKRVMQEEPGAKMPALKLADLLSLLEDDDSFYDATVSWSVQPDGDLHIDKCSMYNFDENGDPLCVFIEILRTFKKKKVESTVVNLSDSGIGLCDYLEDVWEDVLVGTGVGEVMNAGKVLYGPEVLKGEINKELMQEISAAPRTQYYLSVPERASVKKYIGTDVHSSSRKSHNSDHYQLLVARDLARQHLLHMQHDKEAGLETLCMGATFEDFKHFEAHQGYSFYLHMSEAKDDVRVFPPLAAWAAQKIVKAKLPSLNSSRGETTKLFMADRDRLLQIVNDCILHRPAFTTQRKRASQLMYMDSLYEISERRLCLDFAETGAVQAFGILFLPSSFYEIDDFHGSELYNLTEDYDWPDPEQIVDLIWPDVILGFSALGNVPSPGEDASLMETIVGYLHKYITYWIKQSWDHFKDWIRGIVTSPYPFESVIGLGATLLKYDAILKKWLNRIRTWVRDKYLNLTVTWKHGYSNGYRHNAAEWRKWAKQRVYKHDGIQIASEVISRYGEMCVVKFWRTDKADVIVHQPSPPEHLRTMRIWDWNATLRNSPFAAAGTFDPVYTHCLVTDFYEVYAWAIAEPADSLDFSVVATACNRTRRGLDLVSNVSHAGLSVKDQELANFALNVYLLVIRDHRELEWIESAKGLITSKKTNLEDLLEKVGKGLLILATGALCIPAIKFAGWLFSQSDRCDFVERRPEPSVIKEYTDSVDKKRMTVEAPLRTVIPANVRNGPSTCLICGLLRDGDVTGQTFAVDRCTHEAQEVEYGLTTADAAAARNFIETTIDFHRPFVSGTTLDGARKFESFVSTVLTTGTEFSTVFHYLLGGPGTGKSYIARALMYKLEKAGYNCMMYLPLSALKADYDKATINGEAHKFTADTWFMSSRNVVVDMLFVDEFTLVDSLHFKAFVNYVQPKAVFLIGDEKQQHKSPDVSINPGLAASPEWPRIREACSVHELQRNFRFQGAGAAYRVKWLNEVFGYRMYTKETDHTPFRIIDREEYAVLNPKPEESFVFAHGTAQDAFGVNSAPGPGNENHSVYASQGRTCNTSVVAVFDPDRASFQRHGSVIVALTRSREMPLILAHDTNSNVVGDFMTFAGLADFTQERAEALPWPDVRQRVEPTINVDPVNRRLNELIHAQQLEPVDPIEEEEKRIIKFDSTSFEKDCMDLNVLEWTLPFFDTCTYDALPMQFRREYLRDVFWKILEGSERTQRDFHGGWEWVPGASQSKFRVDEEAFLHWLKCRTAFVALHRVGAKIKKLTLHESVGSPWDLVLVLTPNHVARVQKTELPTMNVKTAQGDKLKFLWDESPTGRPYGAYYKPETLNYHEPGLGAPPASIRRVTNNPIPTHFQTFASCPKSQYISNEPEVRAYFEKKPASKGKLRLGKDNYRFAHLIDGSDALNKTGLQHPSVVGAYGKPAKDFTPGFQMNFGNTFFPRTKGGKITRKEKAETRSLVVGAGNLFVGGTNETLRALQRVCGKRPTKGLSKEGYEFMEKAMVEAHRSNHKPTVTEALDVDRILHNFWKDARTRNYLGRAEAEKKKFSNVLTKRVTNKVQYKPHKDGKINNSKTGQTITTTSPYWNLVHGAAMRVVNYLFKNSLKEDVFFDSHEPVDSFRVRMCKAIQALPTGVQYGIVDGEEFDAGQTHGTLVAEMIHRRLSGIPERFIQSYYRIRQPGKFVYSGICSGKTRYEKGSGFPDTLIGNTTLEEMVGHHSITGIGPRVVGLKGDDYFKAQFELKENKEFTKKMSAYTNLRLKVEISLKGGEFTGCTVGREGMYLSIPRIALKAVGGRFRNYKHFAEYQVSLRGKIKEIRDQGWQETIQANADSLGISISTVETCAAIMESISHLSEDQYLKHFKRRRAHNPPPPRYDGRIDMLTFNSF